MRTSQHYLVGVARSSMSPAAVHTEWIRALDSSSTVYQLSGIRYLLSSITLMPSHHDIAALAHSLGSVSVEIAASQQFDGFRDGKDFRNAVDQRRSGM